jgi:integrase
MPGPEARRKKVVACGFAVRHTKHEKLAHNQSYLDPGDIYMYNREKARQFSDRPQSDSQPNPKCDNVMSTADKPRSVHHTTAIHPEQNNQEKSTNSQAISSGVRISPAIMEVMMTRERGLKGKTKENVKLKRRIKKDPFLTSIEQYLRFERRHSDYNITKVMHRIDLIVRRYKVTRPAKMDAYRIEDDLRKRNYSANTIRGYLWALKYMAWSQGDELLVKMPKITKKRVDYLRPEEANTIINAAGLSKIGVRNQAIISMLIYTGLRRKEIINLDLEDVDLEKQLLTVRDRGAGIKNYEENTCYIKSECVPYLQAWLKIRPDTISMAFFTSDSTNQRLTAAGLYQIVRKMGKISGFNRPIYPHLLRHTCGTLMAKRGINLALIQRQLRQKDIQSTMIYLHPDEEALRDNIEAKFKL